MGTITNFDLLVLHGQLLGRVLCSTDLDYEWNEMTF